MSSKSDQDSNVLFNQDKSQRLRQLQNSKHCTRSIFIQFNMNLHFEILKYLNWREIIAIRGINIASFQYSSNYNFRNKIGNYPKTNIQGIFEKILQQNTNIISIAEKLQLFLDFTYTTKLELNI